MALNLNLPIILFAPFEWVNRITALRHIAGFIIGLGVICVNPERYIITDISWIWSPILKDAVCHSLRSFNRILVSKFRMLKRVIPDNLDRILLRGFVSDLKVGLTLQLISLKNSFFSIFEGAVFGCHYPWVVSTTRPNRNVTFSVIFQSRWCFPRREHISVRYLPIVIKTVRNLVVLTDLRQNLFTINWARFLLSLFCSYNDVRIQSVALLSFQKSLPAISLDHKVVEIIFQLLLVISYYLDKLPSYLGFL